MNSYRKVFFIGIGGIGMSALARYFRTLGAEVSGYDLTSTSLTQQLVREGITVFYDDDLSLYPKDAELVIYTPAIPSAHKGLNMYRSGNYLIKKRSEVLGEISENYFTVAVAGSHGKTTVTSMLAHILYSCQKPMMAFLGGICTNYESNFIYNSGPCNEKQKIMIVEADEYDRSFHRLHPDVAIITAVDTDHLDIYGNKAEIDKAFIEFVGLLPSEGFLVIKKGQSIEPFISGVSMLSYSLESIFADVFCIRYSINQGHYTFDLNFRGEEIKNIMLRLAGPHNIENAIAAYTVSRYLGLNNEQICNALSSFKGIKRRFEKIFENERYTLIDDYAHHPEEIKAFLRGVRELYPKRKITAIFQPHLYSRTRDLADEFAQSLSLADDVVLLEIYPAREQPIPGVSSQLIYDRINLKNKHIIEKKDLIDWIEANDTFEVLATIGAGDIDRFLPQISLLLEKKVI